MGSYPESLFAQQGKGKGKAKGWTDHGKGPAWHLYEPPPEGYVYGKGPGTFGWDAGSWDELSKGGWAGKAGWHVWGKEGWKGKNGWDEKGLKGTPDVAWTWREAQMGGEAGATGQPQRLETGDSKGHAGKAAGKGQDTNDIGKGNRAQPASDGLPLSDLSVFLNDVYRLAGIEKTDQPAELADHFLAVCQTVDQFSMADRSQSRLQKADSVLAALDPGAFDPENPVQEHTNRIGTLAWCTQLAALLRLCQGKNVAAMRRTYLNKLVIIPADIRALPVTARIGKLPPGLVLSIFQMFFYRMGTHIHLLEAVQVDVATEIDDKVSYVLTLAPEPGPDDMSVHRKLLLLMFSLHGQRVDWPGAAPWLTCFPDRLHFLFTEDIRPGLQAEIYLAAIGHEKHTVESFKAFHDDPKKHGYTSSFFCNDLGLLQPFGCQWSRQWAARVIQEELLACGTVKHPDEHPQESTAWSWWQKQLDSWQRQGGTEVHPQDAKDAAHEVSGALNAAEADVQHAPAPAQAARAQDISAPGLIEKLGRLTANVSDDTLRALEAMLNAEMQAEKARQQSSRSSHVG